MRWLVQWVIDYGEAEIDKLNHDLAIIFVLIYQKVFQFYIPVNYLILMNMINRCDHMIKNAPTVRLFDRGVDLYHQVSHVAEHEVHDDVDILRILIKVVHFCNTWVIHGRHNFLLSVNRLQLPHLQF